MSQIKVVEVESQKRDADPRKWTPEQVQEFLIEMKGASNSERTLKVGGFLASRFRVQIPSVRTKWVYGYYDHAGNNSAGIPDVLEDAKSARMLAPHIMGKDDMLLSKTASHAAATKNNSYCVDGGYMLVINGVVLEFARGNRTKIGQDAMMRQMVTVEPQIQDFVGGFRWIHGRDEREEYLFFWMHPENFDGPLRLGPDRQEEAGVTVSCNDDRYSARRGRLPRLRCNTASKVEQEKETRGAEIVKMLSQIEGLTTPRLRDLCKATAFRGALLANVEESRWRNIYLTHLNEVVQGKDRKSVETLRTLLSGGGKEVVQLVNEAFALGVVDFSDGEFYAVSPEGVQSQPKGFLTYMADSSFVESDSDASAWLANEIHDRRDDAMTALIESLIRERREAGGGKQQMSIEDAARMVDSAIEQKTVVQEGRRWIRAADGQELVKFGAADKKEVRVSALVRFTMAHSVAGALLELGLSEE